MLANCGRVLFRRSAFEVPKTDRFALLQRVAVIKIAFSPSVYITHSSVRRPDNAFTRRSYATIIKTTPSKPKAHTGKAKATTRRTPVKAKTAAKTKAGTKTKKPAAKKKTTSAKKKRSTKSTTKPKPKPEKKAKSEEQLAVIAKKKERKAIADLKKTALIKELPRQLPQTAYFVVNDELAKEARALSGKDAASKYKALAPEELEHYNHIANQNKSKNEAAYKNFVAAHTPDQIRLANNARRLLKRRLKSPRGFPSIRDERQVKRPQTAYILYIQDRLSSGDFMHMRATDIGRLVGSEWKGLAQEEKDKYKKRHASDLSRYRFEVKTVYGREIQGRKTAA